MSQRLVINLINNGKVVGNIYHSWSGNFLSAIEHVVDLIKAYNKNLTNSCFCNHMFALRFFDKEDDNGTVPAHNDAQKPAYRARSYSLIKNTTDSLGEYFAPIEYRDQTYGLVALAEEDIKANDEIGMLHVTINIDRRWVSFKNACEVVSYNNYKGNPSKLKPCNYNLDNVSFNELEDLHDFIQDNINGFLDKDFSSNMVYIPIT